MLQLRPQCWLVLQGLPRLRPNWFTKYTLLVMNQKIQKLNLGSCHQFLQHFISVCLPVVSENQTELGGGGGGVAGISAFLWV